MYYFKKETELLKLCLLRGNLSSNITRQLQPDKLEFVELKLESSIALSQICFPEHPQLFRIQAPSSGSPALSSLRSAIISATDQFSDRFFDSLHTGDLKSDVKGLRTAVKFMHPSSVKLGFPALSPMPFVEQPP